MSAHAHGNVPADPTPPADPDQQPATFTPVYPPYGPGQPMAGSPNVTGYPTYPVLANQGARLGARLLDVVFWYIGYLVAAIPVMIWIDEDGGTAALSVLVTWLVTSFVLYFPFSTWKFGSTLGKRICKIRVVRRQTGQPIGFWRAVGREAFYLFAAIIPVLGLLNPLWCCWDRPFQQCLHDKVADTMTVTR